MEYPLFKARPPFIPVEKGFGYMGVIMYDDKKDRVQCHICGDWFESLGLHLRTSHAKLTKEYRKEYGLLASTQLAIPRIAKLRRREGSKRYYKYIREKLSPGKNRFLKGGGRNLKTLRMQEMNRKGTCPLQIEDRFDQRVKELGHTPTRKDLNSGLVKALYLRYGTYNNYLRFRGIAPNSTRLTKEEIQSAITKFVKINNYFPLRKDMNMGRVPPLLSYRPVVSVYGGLLKAQKHFV